MHPAERVLLRLPGAKMYARVLMGSLLLGSSFVSRQSAAQISSNPQEVSKSVASVPPQGSAAPSEQTINRILAREKEEADALSQCSPIIETYIQQVRPDKTLGTVPRSDFYFLGQADFRSGLKVHSLLGSEKKGDWMWNYEPAGFLQMIFVDREEFDKIHYRFEYARREFLGDIRCYVYDVSRAPKTRGPRFVGRIWVKTRT